MIANFSPVSQQQHPQIQVRDEDRLFELVPGRYARMQLAHNADHLVAHPDLRAAPRVQEVAVHIRLELEGRQAYGFGDRFDGAFQVVKINASPAVREAQSSSLRAPVATSPSRSISS